MTLVSISRWTALSSYFALLILLMLWFTVIAPSSQVPTSIVLVILVGPLLFPLRGLLHAKPYTHAWTSFLALLYLTHGIVEAYANQDERIYALLEVVFSSLLFTSSMLYARFRSRELRQIQATSDE